MQYGTTGATPAPLPAPSSRRSAWRMKAAAVAVGAGALAAVVIGGAARPRAAPEALAAEAAAHASSALVHTAHRVDAASAGDSNVDAEADAMIAAAAREVERRALAGAGSRGRTRPQGTRARQLSLRRQSLGGAGGANGAWDGDPPTLDESYRPGDLGIAATSKWVPEDHPEGHKECPLHDIDCDEMWPWGKVRITETAPPARDSPLGDNMIGLDSSDDAVVPVENSGLLPTVQPYVDQFDHWPENSKKNKDLLYGTARKVISAKYTGVGDQYVPVEQLENPSVVERQTHEGISDLMFGTWHQGFNKPHEHAIRKHVNMFDQPYRQHQVC